MDLLPFIQCSHLETSSVMSCAVSALVMRQKYLFCNIDSRIINPCVGQILMLINYLPEDGLEGGKI